MRVRAAHAQMTVLQAALVCKPLAAAMQAAVAGQRGSVMEMGAPEAAVAVTVAAMLVMMVVVVVLLLAPP